MKAINENDILQAIRKSEPKKKRVTFFITEDSKEALASWCKKNGVTESSTIEEMIRVTIPEKHFKGR